MTRLRSALGLSGEHDGLAVADVRHPDAVESLLARLHRGGDLPIVTCQTSDTEEVRRLLTFTAIRYPGFRVCLEPIGGTPMAVGVISSLIDDLGSGHDVDDVPWRLSALDHLRQTTWSAVWLPRVSGLTDPTPTMFQHVRSWFPGSGFLAMHAEGGKVLPIDKAIDQIAPRPDSALIHSPLSGSTSIVDTVAAALEPRSVSAVSTVREQVDAFGTAQAVELIAVPLSFHSDSRPSGESIVECPGCGQHHARSWCPFCKMVAPSGRPPVAQGALL